MNVPCHRPAHHRPYRFCYAMFVWRQPWAARINGRDRCPVWFYLFPTLLLPRLRKKVI